jgi:hypothetical protein
MYFYDVHHVVCAITLTYRYSSLTQQITCLILKYWLHVSVVNSHFQAKFYIHLDDLHNEYLRAMGSHVALQYFGNVHRMSIQELNKSVKKRITFRRVH